MRRDQMTHEFVDYVPSQLEDGVLYVSIRFRTVVHLCACGCGTKISTPLSPANWQLAFDGVSISIKPSIGAWGLPCRSHYWIDRNHVHWSHQWTDDQIRRGRAHDDQDRSDYFAERSLSPVDQPMPGGPMPSRWRRAVSKLWPR